LLLNHGLETFFKNDAAYEFACEGVQTCTTDMLSFKGYLHRWYATTAQLAPFTAEKIRPALQKSTAAAIKQCTGGDFGRQCGFEWYQGKYVEPPGTGAGQQMNVLAALSTQLEGRAPVTAKTGGTSKGDPHAGDGMSDDLNDEPKPITMADRAGAGILTFLLLGSACGMFGWMSIGV
jgi:mannan endo-1,6-alpha-mannosidase